MGGFFFYMIRQGNIEDAADMADIFNYYIETSTVIFSNRRRSAVDMADMLNPIIGNYPFFIYEEDGKVLGYCYAHAFHPDPVYSRSWEITIYLRNGHTGQGIGTKLLEAITKASRQGGAHTLISCITDGNTACERMHERAGFIRTGVLRDAGYKFGQYLNDVFYQKIL